MASDTESAGQKPMLASQRKDPSTDTGKPAYFPLGYKDGFSQWVCTFLRASHLLPC
jgi:cardiolipin-specific phospholipase